MPFPNYSKQQIMPVNIQNLKNLPIKQPATIGHVIEAFCCYNDKLEEIEDQLITSDGGNTFVIITDNGDNTVTFVSADGALQVTVDKYNDWITEKHTVNTPDGNTVTTVFNPVPNKPILVTRNGLMLSSNGDYTRVTKFYTFTDSFGNSSGGDGDEVIEIQYYKEI